MCRDVLIHEYLGSLVRANRTSQCLQGLESHHSSQLMACTATRIFLNIRNLDSLYVDKRGPDLHRTAQYFRLFRGTLHAVHPIDFLCVLPLQSGSAL